MSVATEVATEAEMQVAWNTELTSIWQCDLVTSAIMDLNFIGDLDIGDLNFDLVCIVSNNPDGNARVVWQDAV